MTEAETDGDRCFSTNSNRNKYRWIQTYHGQQYPKCNPPYEFVIKGQVRQEWVCVDAVGNTKITPVIKLTGIAQC
jgi:hypothetical protein